MTDERHPYKATAILDAVVWCREHNALVRFWSNGTVTVRMNGFTRRRPTLVEAVDAHRSMAVKARCRVEGCRLPPEHEGLHGYGPNIP